MKRFWILTLALAVLAGCDSSYRVHIVTSSNTHWAVSVQAGHLASGTGDTILVFDSPQCLKATRLTGGWSGPMTVYTVEWRSDFTSIVSADEVQRARIAVADSLDSKQLCW